VSGWWTVLGALLALASLPLAIAGVVARGSLGFWSALDLEPFFLSVAAYREPPGEIRLQIEVPGEYGIWGSDPGSLEFDLRDPGGASVPVEAAPPGYLCDAPWDERTASGTGCEEGDPLLVALGRFVAPESGTYLLRTGAAAPGQSLSCIRTRGAGDPVFDAVVAERRAARSAETARKREEGEERIDVLFGVAALCFVGGLGLWIFALVRNLRANAPPDPRSDVE